MISERIDIELLNKELKDKSPDEIIKLALLLTERKMVTTSFGVYSAVLLNTFFHLDKNIDVIWCDTGYNTPNTYKHATHLINKFQLNIHKYTPRPGTEYTDANFEVPKITDPKHTEFTEVVKLEPFRRALQEYQPEVWFTNIRVRQNEYRNSKDILSFSREGILKISPFYYWTDYQLDNYLEIYNLPKNSSYFDPTKGVGNSECGIHFQ